MELKIEVLQELLWNRLLEVVVVAAAVAVGFQLLEEVVEDLDVKAADYLLKEREGHLLEALLL